MKCTCPTCHKTVNITPSNQIKFFPFCSQRCKLIDLGAWLDGDYKIVSELQSQKISDELSDTSSDSISDNH
jgi:endogenous inhibitor of DNA gyrase (YacG/DUF329 family)